MTMYCLLVLAGGFLDPLPDIFHTIGGRMTALTDDFLFVLDHRESIVYQYNTAGKLVKTFGGKGQGPGRFSRPFMLTWINGVLTVRDFKAAHSYNGRGEFLSMIKTPPNLIPFRVVGGWVALRGFPTDSEIELVFYDEKFSHATPTLSWDVPARPIMSDTVVVDYDELVVSPDGEWVYVKPRDSSTLWRVNARSREIKVIELNLSPIAFDPEHADRLNKSWKKMGLPQRKAPKVYPPILSVNVTFRGNLAITRWLHSPNGRLPQPPEQWRKKTLLMLDRDGEPIIPEPTELYSSLIVSIDKDWVYHVHFDPESETASIIRVTHARAKESLALAYDNQICFSCQEDH